jgi:methyl-accepting chemotaxis protein
MKHALSILHFLLILLSAALLLFGFIPRPYDVLLSAAVLAVTALAVFMSSHAREKRFTNSISKLSRELDVASSRITSVSQEIGITIAENNKSSEALFEQVQEMRHLNADVSTSLGDMILSIKSMISNADETRTTARAMEQTGRDSFVTIQNSVSEIMGIVETMGGIKVTSGKAAASIDKLSAASDDVLTIVDQISDISKQMHIIAVNASVEAVRAGSSGSSFSVVAREFQNLSAMTDKAVKTISSLIGSIEAGIAEAHAAVKENDERVDAGVHNTTAVERNLNQIHRSFSDVIRMVERINSISASEAHLAEAVGGGLEDMEALIEETGENVTLVYQSALSQRKANENISEMCVRLKSASDELLAISDSGAGNRAELLDKETQSACTAYFPVIRDALTNHPDIAENNPERHFVLLSRFKSQHPIIEAVWTNEPSGRFICSIPKAGIANAVMRDWFLAAMKGESYVSSVYISGITKNRCITLSMPCRNEQNEIVGIVGVDLNIDMLQQKAHHR